MKPRQALSPSSRQGGEAMDGPRSCCKGTINSPMNQLFAHLFCLCHGFVAQFLHTLCKVRLSAQSAQVAVLPWRDREQIKTNHLKRTTQTTPTRTKRQENPLWVKLAFRRSSYLYALFGSYTLLSRKTLLNRMRCLAVCVIWPYALLGPYDRRSKVALLSSASHPGGVRRFGAPLSLSSYALIFG